MTDNTNLRKGDSLIARNGKSVLYGKVSALYDQGENVEMTIGDDDTGTWVDLYAASGWTFQVDKPTNWEILQGLPKGTLVRLFSNTTSAEHVLHKVDGEFYFLSATSSLAIVESAANIDGWSVQVLYQPSA